MLFLGVVLVNVSLFALTFIRQTFISILVAIELLLLAVSLVSISFCFFFDFFEGQVFSLFVLNFAAAESAIGLALLVQFYRAKGRIDFDFHSFLKG